MESGMTTTLVASRQVDAVAMHAARALKTLVDIMTGSIEEGKASRTVATVAANCVQAMSCSTGSLAHTFIDVEADSFQFIKTRMAFTPVSSLQIVAFSLDARIPKAALVQVSAAAIGEYVSRLTHALVTPGAVDTLPKEAARILRAFVRVNALASFQNESGVTLTGVRSRCVQAITVAADRRNVCTLVNVGTRTVVGVQSETDLAAAFKASRLVDANLPAKAVLLLALIDVSTSLIVRSDVKSLWTFAVRRTHCVDALVTAEELPIGAFVSVFAITLFIDGKSGSTRAMVRARGVYTQVRAVSVVSGALVDIVAILPVRSQDEALGAHTEHLIIAVNALVRATTIVDRAASNRLTGVVIWSNGSSRKILTRAFVTTIAIATTILARSVAVVQQTLVHIQAVALVDATKGTVARPTLTDEGAWPVDTHLATPSVVIETLVNIFANPLYKSEALVAKAHRLPLL